MQVVMKKEIESVAEGFLNPTPIRVISPIFFLAVQNNFHRFSWKSSMGHQVKIKWSVLSSTMQQDTHYA